MSVALTVRHNDLFSRANTHGVVSRVALRRGLLGREVAVAFAIIAALYLVRFVRFQPLQIPAYLLIVAYDVVELALPVLTPYHSVGFPVFLYGLAVVGARAARLVRSDDSEGRTMPLAGGGVCLVVGTISLVFGAFVGGPLVSPTDNPTPLAITGTTGVVLLVVSWLLLGRPMRRVRTAG